VGNRFLEVFAAHWPVFALLECLLVVRAAGTLFD